ncbi:MAG: ATP-binding protein [Kofleriaceae bacterium]
MTTETKPSITSALRLTLRSKLMLAMVFGALVPVLIVAALATGVVLSSLESGLREDSHRQLTVGLNLVLRAVERFGDEAVQLSESVDLAEAIDAGQNDLENWLSREAPHVASARIQLFDVDGRPILDRVIGGGDARFAHVGIAREDPMIAAGRLWSRDVSLVAIGDQVVVRAMSPVLNDGLVLRGVLVLSSPLDGEFADGIKSALAADVLLGGTSGPLAVTFRSSLGERGAPLMITANDRARVSAGARVVRKLDVATGRYEMAMTGLLDRQNRPVGVLGVAVDAESLAATKRLALRSLIAGGASALAFALVLALFWARRLGSPIARLHRGAIAVSRGDLDQQIDISSGDELSELANAFNQMTATLKDNQARLAARMREIVALHDAGRAVSSVIDLDSVSRKIVDAVAYTFDIQLAALWLVEGEPQPQLRASAARARRVGAIGVLGPDEALLAAESLRTIAARVQQSRTTLLLERAGDDPDHGEAARSAGAPGPLVALPLDRKGRVVGVLVVGRTEHAREFSEADLNLLTTFADQAGAAVENAVLYHEVREASEQLDRKVRLRTAELTAINSELGKALADLRQTQAQLILSERMAGLGLLVAGVAHEINSPTAAIRGSIEGLAGALTRATRHGAELAVRAPSPAAARAIADYLEDIAPKLAERPLQTGVAARKAARELAAILDATRGTFADAQQVASELADLGATPDDVEALLRAVGADHQLATEVLAALTDHVYLHRTTSTVRHAIGQIQRIVGALKTYSHLDQQATRSEADLHEGLETTLTLLHYALRGTVVERHYGNLPKVPVYVDELNQVWTNLIQNAQHAVSPKGSSTGSISIETAVDGPWALVRVIDDGAGVPADVLPDIFEPFFTTKAKGEGTGLGLWISKQIIDKHGGELRCESKPGRTVFEVKLPIAPAIEASTSLEVPA